MDLLKLKYFYETAKLENISHAAAELLISQPALSKAIKNLEDDLEMDLFFRRGKTIKLNKNGKFLFDNAERLFSEVGNLEALISEKKVEGEGNLSIVTTLPYTFTQILDSFFNQYPNVKCQQVPLSQENIHQFIENGKYDLCITTERIDHHNIESLPLYTEDIFLTVPTNFKESSQTSIDLKTLKDDIPFIGLTKQYSFRQLTDNISEKAGYYPSYQVEVEEATAILQLVKKGHGVSFTPETSMNNYDGQVKHLKIENEGFTRTIGLLKHKYMYPTKISQAFIEHSRSYFDNL